MPFAEIGLLRLKESASLDDPTLAASLKQIKEALNEFTGHEFYFAKQEHDPSFIYLLGEWESLDQHYKELHGTPEFKERVMVMARYFDFQWMAHYDFAMDAVEIQAPVLGIVRFVVDQDKKQEVDTAARAYVGELDAVLGAGKAVSGWKLDEQRKDEEFAVVIPWQSAEQQEEFTKTRGASTLQRLRELSQQVDIQRVNLLRNSVQK